MLDDAGKNVGQFWISKDTYGINLITDSCSLAEENKFFFFFFFFRVLSQMRLFLK